MSFPHSNNTLKAAITQLKEVVSRHQGEDHETVAMVSEIETIVSDIERKAVTLSISTERTDSQVTTSSVYNPVPVV